VEQKLGKRNEKSTMEGGKKKKVSLKKKVSFLKRDTLSDKCIRRGDPWEEASRGRLIEKDSSRESAGLNGRINLEKGSGAFEGKI